MTSFAPTLSTRCCSDLRLDRFLSGELSFEDAAALRAHLALSPLCGDRCEALARDRAAFARRPLPAFLEDNKVTPLRRFAPLVGAIAAAAVFVLMSRPPEPDAVRVKGGGLVVWRGEPPVPAAEAIAPGDLLRFSWPAARGRRVVVVNVDDTGRATLAALAEAGDELLPGAVELDHVGARERFVAFACEGPVDAEALVRDPAVTPPGCTRDELVLRKDHK